MGNTYTLPCDASVKAVDTFSMFHTLDVEDKEYLTIKDLMAATSAGLMMPHSLPALYFFDDAKDGTLTLAEFVSLVQFCHSEKRKVEDALRYDKQFRDLIHRASKAGVKDCSIHGRSSFRRFSSYCNVRSVFSSRQSFKSSATSSCLGASASGASASVPPRHPTLGYADDFVTSQSPSDSSDSGMSQTTVLQTCPTSTEFHHDSESPVSSDQDVPPTHVDFDIPHMATVSMYSAQNEFDPSPEVSNESSCDPDCWDPKNRTALDAAVLENIMHTNIHKLADLLHTEGSREQFMSWLWNLVNFNHSGVVTLEELRVFLAALSEDGIDLEELVFYKEVGVPLEECIINEFDTTHAGLLSRDEFMVLADLVTREYEFWENRHLERIGDFELGRTIGRGSSGVVRFAVHVETRQKVAVKIIKKGKCSDLSRLDREIQSLMAAKHKNIVALEEVLDSRNNLFVVMGLCGGGTLVDIVRLYPEERMPEETARFFIRQVFEALAFCHRHGICHRDVRLDNLMLDNDGNVKLADFGHSGIYAPGWDLFSTSLVGSVYNLSPEQIRGDLYSGEKIDVWSAGVAVYCLLVGRPPFFEPEVTPLLERITACDFDTPSFLSQKARDFIRCMIRAAPEDRISIQQMLHHPWFYDGPEYRPSMNVVVIPIDAFFKTRPDIAEMIMAITIYQHNLHFHLGDSQNPTCSPEDHRGQEWTLKCLCPKNDIKFTISLFTREPSTPEKMTTSQLPATASFSSLPISSVTERSRGFLASEPIDRPRTRSHRKMPSEAPSVSQLIEVPSCGKRVAEETDAHLHCLTVQGSAARPPLRRRMMKITPLFIAAHIRDAVAHGSNESSIYNALLDLESGGNSREYSADRHETGKLATNSSKGKGTVRSDRRKRRKGKHVRSHSLDDESFMRISRSATVDAFPYQKVYPKREMPESVRNLNFDTPRVPALGSCFDAEIREDRNESREQGSSQLHRFHRSVTLQAVSSYNSDFMARSLTLDVARDNDIAEKLSKHPSKTVSPQSSQVHRSAQCISADELDELSSISASGETSGIADPENMSEDNAENGDVDEESLGKGSINEFQPFIEVRLSDGESGVFLKICRKLKTICATKLAAAAARQNTGNLSDEGHSLLHRTDSEKSIHSDVTAEESSVRSNTFNCRNSMESTREMLGNWCS